MAYELAGLLQLVHNTICSVLLIDGYTHLLLAGTFSAR